MDYRTIIVEEKDMIGRIKFNNPPLNILNIKLEPNPFILR